MIKNMGVQPGASALHIAVSLYALLPFGVVGGGIFDLKPFFHCNLGLMPEYEEEFLQ
jgi:hypothetical protein